MKILKIPELIVALDRPSLKECLALLDRLPDSIRYVKVGLELFIAEGPEVLLILQRRQKNIFLDLKLHDIPNTVARAVTSAARLGVSLLTVHAGGGRAMLQAAAEAARQAGPQAPKLIAVTALTSLGPADLAELGIQRAMPDQVLALGEIALGAGMDGLVCSVHEAEMLRRRFGPSPILITPGIRPSCVPTLQSRLATRSGGTTEDKPSCVKASAVDTVSDQKRIATPAMAVNAGASFIVVGRPILDAPDPHAAATAILQEMQSAALSK